jgi:Flp pilus assembly protein CpaB
MSIHHSSESRNRCCPNALVLYAGVALASAAVGVLWAVVVHPAPLPLDQASERVPEKKAQRSQPQPDARVKVLVAKKDLDLGTSIEIPQELFEEKLIAKTEMPEEAVRELSTLKSKLLKRPLQAGSFVAMDDLWDRQGGAAAFRLPKGMRAMAIHVENPDHPRGNDAWPGTRVDILYVGKYPLEVGVIKTLARNVLVLEHYPPYYPPVYKSLPCQSNVAVALMDDDFLQVALSQEMGSLRLVHRVANAARASSGKQ